MSERILKSRNLLALPCQKKAVQSALSWPSSVGATLVALRVIPRYPRSYLEGGATVDISEIKRIEAQWTGPSTRAIERHQSRGQKYGCDGKNHHRQI